MTVSRETSCYIDWPDHKILCFGAEKLGVNLSREQAEKMLDYLNLLRSWNRKISLVGTEKKADQVVLHLLDSLAPLPFVNKNCKNVMDFGSGAGLPGLLLKIMNEEWEMTLVDSREKKTAFIKQAIRKLGLERSLVLTERLGSRPLKEHAGKYDLISFRAVGDLLDLAGLLKGYLVPDGGLLAYLGPKQKVRELEPELSELGYVIDWVRDFYLPFLERPRRISLIVKNK